MKKRTGGAVGLLLSLLCAPFLYAQSNPPATPAASSPPDVLTVPEGQRLVLELQESLYTRSNRKGDKVRFTTLREVLVGYQVAIPPGSTVWATLTKVKRPGRLKGRAEIRLRFDEIEFPDGTTLPFTAQILRAGFRDVESDKDELRVRGEGNKKGDIINVAVRGAEGALLGVLLGGKKGAAYGGAIGAGAGLLGLLLERGPELSLPAGMFFEVKLASPLEVPSASAVQWTRRPPAPPTAGSPGGFNFPTTPTARRSEEPAIPDFEGETPGGSEGSTAEDSSAPGVHRPPSSPTGTESEPLPPVFDPTLGDPEGYRMRVNVQLVLVEAFVRDEHGRPLGDLTREDFRLFEDGVEQKIRHFSRDELPLAIALVVDRSGSVAPYMPELRRAAYETLSRLKPGDQVALFAFASDVRRLENLTTDRRRIAERIARIRAGGGTNIVDALFEATYYLSVAAPDRRRAIILISDNHGTERGSVGQGDLIRVALEAGVVVYSIKTPGVNSGGRLFGIPLPSFGIGSVKDIAEETGGEVIDVKRTGSLRAALDAVVSRLKTRYTLGYHSTNKARDGSFRKIDVRLAQPFGRYHRDYSVHARKGYYAPDDTTASTPQPTDNR
ncbi:MAG: VWA domain-containing protein [Candidatus Acidoferrales bacterium]